LKPDKSGSFSPTALNAKENPSFQKQPASPVENQAQKLIEQVRGAILSLSSSSYLFDPIAEPFCDALKRLKPLIDQLIDAVSREGVQPIGEARESGEARKERFAPSRFKAASSEREIQLKGLVSFPKKEQKSRSISPQVERGEEPAKLTKEPLAKTKSSSLFSDSPLTSAKENSSKTTGPIDPVKTTERTSIPSAPYFSSISASFSPRKTKRKRKSFWFREDETSPERDNS
jgi:hypothetical protein